MLHNFDVCSLPGYQHFVVILAVALFEAWLGGTNKIRASSILDLLLGSLFRLIKRMAIRLFTFIRGKYENR